MPSRLLANRTFNFSFEDHWCWTNIVDQFTCILIRKLIWLQWCWSPTVGDNVTMVTILRCWWSNHYVDDFCRYFCDVFNVNNDYQHLKVVTNTDCLQHPSPTLIGYIDVGDKSMLVTLCRSQFFNASDRISIFVTSFECWCPTPV